MEGEDLADLSPDEEEEEEASDEDAQEEVDGGLETPVPNLRDLHVRCRFAKWLAQLPGGSGARSELLWELFSLLTVSRLDLQVVSSERRFSLDFSLASMQGHYHQSSQADAFSSVWDASGGDFVLRPNVEAEFVLDDEVLASCKHFAMGQPVSAESSAGSSSKKPSPWVDQVRVSDRFGSETLEKLGGLRVLLEFLGTICVDSCTGCYAEVLPFGLAAGLFDVSFDPEEIPRSPAASKSKHVSLRKNQSSTSQPAAPKRPPHAAKASAAPGSMRPAIVTLGGESSTPSVTAVAKATNPATAAIDGPGASAAYPASTGAAAVAKAPLAPAGTSAAKAPPAAAAPAVAKASEASPSAPPARPSSRGVRPRPGAGNSSAKSTAAAKTGGAPPGGRTSSPRHSTGGRTSSPRHSSRGASRGASRHT